MNIIENYGKKKTIVTKILSIKVLLADLGYPFVKIVAQRYSTPDMTDLAIAIEQNNGRIAGMDFLSNDPPIVIFSIICEDPYKFVADIKSQICDS